MSQNIKKHISPKTNFIILGAVLLTTLVLVIIFALNSDNRESTEDLAKKKSPDGITTLEKWQEGTIRFEDKSYTYNTSIRTFLLMGIDREGTAVTATDFVSGGQSDTMFLLVCDKQNMKNSIIPINRNTMTPITVCDANGRIFGTFRGQICLQHGYGDGMRLSCNRSIDAVKNLFMNIPICGYIALNMDGISILNDAVGGVTVTLSEDFIIPEKGIDLKEGETVTLTGEQAYLYSRYRNTDVFDSASNRLIRNMVYISALTKRFDEIAHSGIETAVSIYNSLSDYMVSSVDFSEIATALASYGFNPEDMVTISGTTKQGSVFEEFELDEEDFHKKIARIFYTPLD